MIRRRGGSAALDCRTPRTCWPGPAFLGVPPGTRLMPSQDQATLCSSQPFPDPQTTAADCPGRVVRDSPQEERGPATSRQNGQAKRTGKPDRRSLKRMEPLTLILHKSKETKNKVVYGTKDGGVIQSVYIDKDALGDVSPATIQVVISPQCPRGRASRFTCSGRTPPGAARRWGASLAAPSHCGDRSHDAAGPQSRPESVDQTVISRLGTTRAGHGQHILRYPDLEAHGGELEDEPAQGEEA